MNVNSKWAFAIVDIFKSGESYDRVNVRHSLFKDVDPNCYYRSKSLTKQRKVDKEILLAV